MKYMKMTAQFVNFNNIKLRIKVQAPLIIRLKIM